MVQSLLWHVRVRLLAAHGCMRKFSARFSSPPLKENRRHSPCGQKSTFTSSIVAEHRVVRRGNAIWNNPPNDGTCPESGTLFTRWHACHELFNKKAVCAGQHEPTVVGSSTPRASASNKKHHAKPLVRVVEFGHTSVPQVPGLLPERPLWFDREGGSGLVRRHHNLVTGDSLPVFSLSFNVTVRRKQWSCCNQHLPHMMLSAKC